MVAVGHLAPPNGSVRMCEYVCVYVSLSVRIARDQTDGPIFLKWYCWLIHGRKFVPVIWYHLFIFLSDYVYINVTIKSMASDTNFLPFRQGRIKGFVASRQDLI